MTKALVTFFSKSGHTKEMAFFISESLKKDGLDVNIKPIDKVKVDDLLKFEVILIGSPTYYGVMAKEIKELLDKSVRFHGQLKGKIGGAFTSAANIGGGNETTILSILNAFLVHGMIITGNPFGDHYGPVSIGKPGNRAKDQCVQYAEIIAELTKRIYRE